MPDATTLINRPFSFVQINDFSSVEQTDCYPAIKNTCYPINALTEISFQLGVTEYVFEDVGVEFYFIPVPVNANGLTQITPCESLVTEEGLIIHAEGLFGDLSGLVLDECEGTEDECDAGIFEYDLTGNGVGATLPESYALMKYYIESQSAATNVEADMLYVSNNEWVESAFPATIPVGQCFRFIIVQTNTDINGDAVSSYRIGCTNCFVRIDDICDTSVIQYRGYEEQFGFIYDDPNDTNYFWNAIRLPFYLANPQFNSSEKGYQKSDGRFVKLSERIQKEYDLLTDYMPEVWHEKLRIALSHDDIYIYNSNITTDRLQPISIGIYRSEPYEILWQDIRLPEAPAKTKVIKSEAIQYLNSNCNNG